MVFLCLKGLIENIFIMILLWQLTLICQICKSFKSFLIVWYTICSILRFCWLLIANDDIRYGQNQTPCHTIVWLEMAFIINTRHWTKALLYHQWQSTINKTLELLRQFLGVFTICGCLLKEQHLVQQVELGVTKMETLQYDFSIAKYHDMWHGLTKPLQNTPIHIMASISLVLSVVFKLLQNKGT